MSFSCHYYVIIYMCYLPKFKVITSKFMSYVINFVYFQIVYHKLNPETAKRFGI